MSKAATVYEEIKDRLQYTLKSYLRLDLPPATMANAYHLAGAGAFLFDNLFLKEGAGMEITALVAEDSDVNFDPKQLSSLATKIRVNMSSENFSGGSSPLRDYLRWVSEAKPEVKYWEADLAGKLCICLTEELVNLAIQEGGAKGPLRVSEYFFLNFTVMFALLYKECLGLDGYRALKSYIYFQDVEEESERIRGEIGD